MVTEGEAGEEGASMLLSARSATRAANGRGLTARPVLHEHVAAQERFRFEIGPAVV